MKACMILQPLLLSNAIKIPSIINLLYQLLLHYYNKIHDRNNIREEGFILAHGFRGISVHNGGDGRCRSVHDHGSMKQRYLTF